MKRTPILCSLALLLGLSLAAEAKKKVVLIAGRDSHGATAHNWGEGVDLLSNALTEQSGFEIETAIHKGGWPKDPSIFDGADTIVILSDGGGGHPAHRHIDEIQPMMDKGVGWVCIHYAVEIPKGKSGDAFLDWMGGYFETHWSVNPHWEATFDTFPDHPVARGLKPFTLNDEWYYHMKFRPNMEGVTPILSALPPESTLKRGDGPHSNNPHVKAAVLERKEPQHVAWAATRPDGGRGFGTTGAHYHKSWDNDSFRTMVLNAIVWSAKLDVPKDGVKSLPNPTLVGKGGPKKITGSKPTKGPKPLFESKVMKKEDKVHAVDIDVDIKGAKELYLVVTDGGDGYGCDWADWAEPRLVGPKGEKKLTDLKWASAAAGWGQVQVGKNAGGQPLRTGGKSIAYGIGVHANSVIAYKLPEGYHRFKARGALDNGGTDQACGTSVQFAVYTQRPKLAVSSSGGGGGGASRSAEDALAGLDVGEGLEAATFAHEPMMVSPSTIDIDHRGRVWVGEVINYRRHNGKRPEGDRILILEDKTGDGKADDVKVFYQGRDIDSLHGIAVLGEKVIVSVGDKVMVFTDSNGDDKPDNKELLFTGISGTQHDHGIHAFHFGPDGRLYFNFGNSGKQIKDKDGKVIVDMAGNEVAAKRKPYQEGMVFRCEMDGSNFETLGWNFRNNWEACVDSFGSVWQSDNDDDGNKGVRINYVMEFGNYGYKDEFTGAGWRSKRTNMEKLPELHWYQNDPGVVPNFLHTGAGSPTGIIVYEGDALPKAYQNQVIHCDAGPNVCRAYPATKKGAGYTGEMLDVLKGTRDRWYRPSDVCVAPDGTLIVADWYDPGVGGHGMGDLERGRLFRVTAEGGTDSYKTPTFDFGSAKGAASALKNSNMAVRYKAWTSLNGMQGKAKGELEKLAKDANPRYRARALWLLAAIEGNTENAIKMAAGDKDEDIRGMAIRIARRHKQDVMNWVKKLSKDASPQVRRECAIALRFETSSEAAEIWADLAMQHEAGDRWYLEALGIASDLNAAACFDAWVTKVGKGWNAPAGRDIVWRSRSPKAMDYLVKIVTDSSNGDGKDPRYMRAFDFHTGEGKQAALQKILGL